ncbi:Hypothetical protein R9X50_00612100 [Acrodontium crateriforme]|uniref:2-oxoadipate dioxygenase/decarboxylase n=1 Tax=Acrodontium crateriforme TaxID=150365 RepID=A0AAQ3M7S0_9PEZI|nr:Hypothetical protein R9X50_00612100 [Acrodontium crateriforme]
MTIMRNADGIRSKFSMAMSNMYKNEVPLYAELLSIVADVDERQSSEPLPKRNRIERHGAIRLGTAQELQTIARLFSLFNMHPIGYYDLSMVGFPFHATAFRPLTSDALAINPFRVFTSLLRLDLLPEEIRRIAEYALSKQDDLVTEALKTFKWHSAAEIAYEEFNFMRKAHPIVADICSFSSAHINHLTPRTIDIDLVQDAMMHRGMKPKDRIEGPPYRACAILLRQTSFKALDERVRFDDGKGHIVNGHHTARFGEVEQRGAAVTAKGRALYDSLLHKVELATAQKGGGEKIYQAILCKGFEAFPDNWSDLRKQGLVYFEYSVRNNEFIGEHRRAKLSELIESRHIIYKPIVYEDFLPISAAGIFTSNIAGSSNKVTQQTKGDITLFQSYLGGEINEANALYESMQLESLKNCRRELGLIEIIMDE